MKFLDNLRAKREAKLKAELEEAKSLVDDAKSIMNGVESPFVNTTKAIADYDLAVKTKPKKAHGYARNAYESALRESEAAKIHIKAEEILESQDKTGTRSVKRMDSKYRGAVASGNTKKASKLAFRMYAVASKEPDPSQLRISLDDTEMTEGGMDIIVSNKESKPVIVNAINARSGTLVLYTEENMTEVIQAGGQTSRAVSFEPVDSMDIIITVKYECGYEHNSLRRTFIVRKQE